MNTKYCPTCKTTKLTSEFFVHPSRKDGLSYDCISCQRAYRSTVDFKKRNHINKKKWIQTPRGQISVNKFVKTESFKTSAAKYRKSAKGKIPSVKWRLKNKYGITLQQYQEMIERQNYKCLSCDIDLKQLQTKDVCVDHDHLTGKVRGILCQACNNSLGRLGEDPDKIYKLAIYARTYCKK
jgi:hypothetical protein